MAIVIGPTNWNITIRDLYIGAAKNCPLGTTLADGSSLICKSNGVAFFVAPSASQVSRTWYNRNDAVTTAQACTGCTDWFVPSCSQLITGYNCRSFWNSYAGGFSPIYYSNTEISGGYAWGVRFSNGAIYNVQKCIIYCVRAFRCVTY